MFKLPVLRHSVHVPKDKCLLCLAIFSQPSHMTYLHSIKCCNCKVSWYQVKTVLLELIAHVNYWIINGCLIVGVTLANFTWVMNEDGHSSELLNKFGDYLVEFLVHIYRLFLERYSRLKSKCTDSLTTIILSQSLVS